MTGGETAPEVAEVDESLSTAFLLLLERLTPIRRAVFLLRGVFDYDYAEIGGMLGLAEANCRQVLRRAKQHVMAGRPRFEVSPGQRLLEQFVAAAAQGDLEGLVALLSTEVVLYTDGGGRAKAVPNPGHGPVRVARFFLGARDKLIPGDVVRRMTEINGRPGIVEVAAGRLRNIYIVSNPDPLGRLPMLPTALSG